MSGLTKNRFECVSPDPELEESMKRANEMTFWGLMCIGNKYYTTVVKQRFRLTMAVLDPRSYNPTYRDRTCLVSVYRGTEEFLLCVLRHGQIEQVNLNVVFEMGESIKFHINGYGIVFLTGYNICDTEPDFFYNSYPIGGKPKSIANLSVVKSNTTKKDSNEEETCVVENENMEEYGEDSNDEDYVVESSSDTGSDGSEESADDSVVSVKDAEEVDSDEMYEEETKGLIEDVKEVIQNSPESKKKKILKTPQSKKRLKGDTAVVSTPEDADLICLNGSDDNVASIHDTPVATKQMNTFVVTNEMNAPVATNQMNAPVATNQMNAPVATKQTKSPVTTKQTKSPVTTKQKKSPVTTKQTNSPVTTKEMNSPVVATKQMSTPVATKQMNTPVVSSEKKKRKKRKSIGVSVSNDENAKSPADKSPKRKKQKHSVVQLTDGIEVQDAKIGLGPSAVKGKLVHIFYMGRLENQQIFDAKRPPQRPMSFKLGAGHVLPGLDQGIEGMKVGGIRKIKVPPKMGYGNKQINEIPPDSTLYFTVDLQAIS